jgi:hypothetical protein
MVHHGPTGRCCEGRQGIAFGRDGGQPFHNGVSQQGKQIFEVAEAGSLGVGVDRDASLASYALDCESKREVDIVSEIAAVGVVGLSATMSNKM